MANDGPPIPIPGTNEVLINSTGGGLTPASPLYGVYGSPNAVSALPGGPLTTFLGVASLPNGVDGSAPTNGQAIQQSFTTPGLGSARVSFYYAYASRESPTSLTDQTGYVLNGTFHILANSSTPGVAALSPGIGFFTFGLPYQQGSITVGPGTNNLGFVTYNTGNDLSPSGLFLDNIVVIPLFGTVPGLTPNQQAVATGIDNVDTTGALSNLITQLGNAPNVSTLAAELNQLSPQSLQIFGDVAINNTTFNTLDINNHLANLRDGLTGFDGSQMTVNDPGRDPKVAQIANRLHDPKEMSDPKNMRDAKEMVPASQPSSTSDRWSTFIAGQFTLAGVGHDGSDTAHEDYTTGSVMLGFDYRLDDHFTVGGLLDYSHSDLTLDHDGSSGTVDSYSPGLYASYVDGPWYGNALVTYGFNSYTDDRNINIGTIDGTDHGAPDGNQYTGSLTGGYEFRSGQWKYGPIAGVQYVHLDINSFTENGPTALQVGDESVDSFRSQLGFEVRYATHCGSLWMTPHASATWQHEYLDGSRGITSQFAGVGGSSFTVQTTSPDHDSAVIDIGLDLDVCQNVTLFTDYETEAGAADFFSQSVQAGVKIGF